jgi:hypothetical protein
MNFLDQLRRIQDDSEQQLSGLETGRFHIYEVTSVGQIDRTDEHKMLLRDHIEELRTLIDYAAENGWA